MAFQSSLKSGPMIRVNKGGAVISFIALGLFCHGLDLGVGRANAATDNLTAQADIVGPMSIDCSGQDLNFGSITVSAAPGTVAVNTAGIATDGGGATYVSGATAGICVLQGNASSPYEIDYIVNDLTGPGANMPLTSLVSENANGDGPFAGVGTHVANLDVSGNDTLTIGATLNVGAGQMTGSYTGTIAVTVDYP